MHVRAGAGVIDGVEQREQVCRLVALAELREGHHRPHGGVGVLAAIFADARRIALDIAGIARRSCRMAA